MPHISSKKLDSKLSEKIFDKLLVVLGQAQNKNLLSLVVNELFTHTEKIMFAKRIAVILMLDNNIPQHRITELLKMSPSTIAKMSLKIEMGKCDAILKVSKRGKIDIEKLVWNILTAGGIMPPKVGKRYWLQSLKK
jgi:Trp operon repressor